MRLFFIARWGHFCRGALRPMLVTLWTAAAMGAAAQTNAPESTAAEWVVRVWQTKDGLPQNTPYAIVQSRDGFLWVGTGGGLARFDGTRFRTFGLEDGLRSVQVLRLYEDRQGVLWVGTVGGGLSRWDNGRFTTYGKAEGLAAAAVQALAGDVDGSLWIGTESGLLRGQKGAFAKVGPEVGLPAGQVRALLLDSKGALWVSVLSEGVYVRQGDRFKRVEGGGQTIGGVYSLLEGRGGTIWAGGGSGTLWEGRGGSWKRHNPTNGLPRGELQALAEGGDGTLWVGVRGAGLYFAKEGRFHSLTAEAELSSGSISALFVDQEQMVWVGVAGRGLYRLSRRVLDHWGEAEGLKNATITSVAEDSSGRLWVTTPGGGMWRFQQKRFSQLDDPAVAGKLPHGYAAVATEDGSIWAAGEQFLCRFREGQATQVFLDAPVRGEAIRALCADGTNLWLGTYYSTLLHGNGSGVRVVATNGSFGGGITSLVREGAETVWIGTSDGLYRWERGTVKSWGTKDGLLTSNIGALHRDADGTLWIGTVGGGLARLKEGRITSITRRHGLVDDVVSQIVADDFGHLWLGCNRGIMRVERRELESFADGKTDLVHPVVLGANDGMLREQCTGGHSPTAVKTRDGRLLFPTMGGLVQIDPRRVLTNTALARPMAVIEAITLDDVPQPPGTNLVVPPGDHHVDVHYNAPSLRAGDWVRFRTRLVGLDGDWMMAGTRRTASYAGLRPGRYEFQVAACDSKGVWSERATSLAIIVQPAVWQTAWFGSLLGLLVVGVAFVGYRRRIGGLEAERKAQETLTRQLIGAQEAERGRLARELHDDITQRLALLAIDAGRVERANGPGELTATMRGVREGLVRLSEDVHALSYRLHSSLLEDLGLAEALKAECERVSRQESIHAEVKLIDLPPNLPREPALGLFRIAQEALRNVARHARASAVTVTLRAVNGGLQLAVQDNGVGFDSSRKSHHVSLGLASMRERAGLLGGELDIESAPGHGTTIIAWVPFQAQKA